MIKGKSQGKSFKELSKILDDDLKALKSLSEHLDNAREDLLNKHEELEALNEKYRASEEELRMANEELEATAEELRTSTEELEASNQMLNEKKADLESLFTAISDYITVLDPKLNVIQTNQATLKLLKAKRPQEVLGKKCYYVYHKKKRPCLNCPCLEVLRTKKSVYLEKFSQGTGRHLSVCASPVFDKNGNILKILEVSRDITERMQAEEALAREQYLMQALMDNIPDYIYFKDRESRFIRISKAHSQSFGLNDPVKAMGKTDFDFFTEEHARQAYKDEQKIIRTGQPLMNIVEKETRSKRPDAWVLTTKMPLWDRKGRIVGTFGISRDITDRKQAEEKLKQTASELASSNKELEHFAYVASHDLKEPLRMVTSYVQLLKRRYNEKLDNSAHEFIEYAIDGAIRMQKMIDDLLIYSRVGTRGKPFTAISCDATLSQAIDNLKIALKESKALVTQDKLPEVYADETQLIQLFQNLLSNSLKFCDKKQPRIHVSAEKNSREWIFSVRDNGIGFDPQHTERIFKIFQRLHGKKEYPGTGIGLAVCKRIVERHRGRIWVDSQPGKGATFYFTLPSRRKIR